jgi:hypothetical protein
MLGFWDLKRCSNGAADGRYVTIGSPAFVIFIHFVFLT